MARLFAGVQYAFTEKQRNIAMDFLEQTAYYTDPPKKERLVETEIICPICNSSLRLWQKSNSFTLYCQEHGALQSFRSFA